MNEIIGIIVASVICWLNFVIIDTYFGLPQQPGVKGVQTVGDSIEKRNGDCWWIFPRKYFMFS